MLLPDRFAEQDYGVASAKEKTDLAEEVEKVVTRMLSDGSMDAMKAKWHLL